MAWSVPWLDDERAFLATILFSVIPILMLLARHVRVEMGKKARLPPSPFKLPIIGNLHQLGKLPHLSLRDLSLKHGPLMLIHLGPIRTVVVSSEKMAHEIMKTHDLNFANRPSMRSAKHLFYDSKAIFVTPYGEYWRELRKICMTQLLTTKRVQSFRFVREEEVALLIENISRSCNPSGLINLSDVFSSLTLDIICRIVLGNKYSEPRGEGHGKSRFPEMMKEILVLLGAFHVGDFFPSMAWIDVLTGTVAREKRFSKEMDGFLDQVIQDHLDPKREETDHKDLVDVLLQVQKDWSLGVPFTVDHIKAFSLDMIMGGNDTISRTMEWVMAELAKHPDAMKKAQEEIRRVAGGKLVVEEGDLHRMEFLKSTIKETLRLHPPAPLLLPRESINDVVIEGYLIPAKSMVFTNAWAIGRDPTLWDGADEFRPERFMNSSIDFKGHDFQLIPFGAGRRGCPGILLALPVVELTVANLLRQFNWELPDGVKPEDIDRAEEVGMASHKKTSLLLVATPSFT